MLGVQRRGQGDGDGELGGIVAYGGTDRGRWRLGGGGQRGVRTMQRHW